MPNARHRAQLMRKPPRLYRRDRCERGACVRVKALAAALAAHGVAMEYVIASLARHSFASVTLLRYHVILLRVHSYFDSMLFFLRNLTVLKMSVEQRCGK